MPRILPPVLWLIAIAVMIMLHYFWPVIQVILPPFHWLGVPVALLGLGIAIWHKRLFKKRHTNINTFAEPDLLVTEGLFQYSRNPMYLGFVLALMGIFIFLGSLTPALVVIFFTLVTHCWYIRFEEQVLQQKFGDHYLAYKSKVRRWL